MHADDLDQDTACEMLRTQASDRGVPVTELACRLTWRAHST
jgi:hypothetical protein